MPIHIISEFVASLLTTSQWIWSAIILLLLAIIRRTVIGRSAGWERNMHGCVVIVTGGTTGIGLSIVADLAKRGTQICLLVRDMSDPLLLDFISLLRVATNNQLIYAETCNLESLDSVRAFADRFNNVAKPRRLDGIICCAGYFSHERGSMTQDGIESHWQVNYLSHFLLLNLLMPCIKGQPPDRSVRIIMHTCSSYLIAPPFPPNLSDLKQTTRIGEEQGDSSKHKFSNGHFHGSSKLALLSFVREFQRRINGESDDFEGKEHANNDSSGTILPKPFVKIFAVNPGTTRSGSLRKRWTQNGTRVWASLIYLLLWPFLWLFLKSPNGAAQSALFLMYSPRGEKGKGGCLIVDCEEAEIRRSEAMNLDITKKLWDESIQLCQEQAKKSKQSRKKK